MKHHLVEDSEGACGTESLTEGWGVWHLSSVSLLIHTASHLQQFSWALHTGQPCSPRQAEDLRQWSQVITVSSFHMQRWGQVHVRVWGGGREGGLTSSSRFSSSPCSTSTYQSSVSLGLSPLSSARCLSCPNLQISLPLSFVLYLASKCVF